MDGKKKKHARDSSSSESEKLVNGHRRAKKTKPTRAMEKNDGAREDKCAEVSLGNILLYLHIII